MKQVQSAACKALFLLLLSTGAASAVQAQKELASAVYAANKIQFIGVEDDLPIFDLHLSNLPAQPGSVIKISDGDNNEILKNVLFIQR